MGDHRGERDEAIDQSIAFAATLVDDGGPGIVEARAEAANLNSSASYLLRRSCPPASNPTPMRRSRSRASDATMPSASPMRCSEQHRGGGEPTEPHLPWPGRPPQGGSRSRRGGA